MTDDEKLALVEEARETFGEEAAEQLRVKLGLSIDDPPRGGEGSA